MTSLLVAAALAAAAAAVAVRPAGGALAVRGVHLAGDPVARRQAPGARQVQSIASRWQHRRRVVARRAATVEFCTALAAELRAGAMPSDSIQRAATAVPGVCDEAARVARLGGDVSAALVAASVRNGSGGLARVGAVWSVSQHAGAGLADGCERIADWLREDEALRREVGAQLAGARASARLLAALPVLGILLGSSMGADPLHVLLRTPYGLVCLALGAALASLGLWWTERLARSVEKRV